MIPNNKNKEFDYKMIASFFAGVGGIDIAFKQAGFHTAYANEIDQYAATTFRLNFVAAYLLM